MPSGCNICSNCNNCNNGPTGPTGDFCNLMQNFCSTSGQAASANGFNFDFGPFNGNDIIIKVMPQAELNAMGAAVQAMAAFGNLVDSGAWVWNPETGDFVYSARIIHLAEGINSLGGGTTVPVNAPVNGVITGAYFTTLANAINNMLLNDAACHVCNASCAVTCQTCDTCNSCQHSSCHSSD